MVFISRWVKLLLSFLCIHNYNINSTRQGPNLLSLERCVLKMLNTYVSIRDWNQRRYEHLAYLDPLCPILKPVSIVFALIAFTKGQGPQHLFSDVPCLTSESLRVSSGAGRSRTRENRKGCFKYGKWSPNYLEVSRQTESQWWLSPNKRPPLQAFNLRGP